MSNLTRRTAVLTALAGAAAAPAALAQTNPVPDITGSYKAEGRSGNGAPYQGSAAIVQNGTDVSITWTVDGQVYQGKGTRAGMVAAFDWGSKHPIVYVIMPNGNLHGTWDDGRALEKLTKL